MQSKVRHADLQVQPVLPDAALRWQLSGAFAHVHAAMPAGVNPGMPEGLLLRLPKARGRSHWVHLERGS